MKKRSQDPVKDFAEAMAHRDRLDREVSDASVELKKTFDLRREAERYAKAAILLGIRVEIEVVPKGSRRGDGASVLLGTYSDAALVAMAFRDAEQDLVAPPVVLDPMGKTG